MSKYKHRYAGQRPHELTRQEVIARIQRNGITAGDLQKNWDMGYEAGKSEGIAYGFNVLLASMLLALHRKYGFGAARLQAVTDEAAQIQIQYMTLEAIEALLNETGLDIGVLGEPFGTGGV